ncbi:MAG TPA: VOC family protein [Gemmatimonadales bacterium]|jgi:catechol 2,3-dioxygenase|nr:VOC family protein [Gemmatimonadales bacterium]
MDRTASLTAPPEAGYQIPVGTGIGHAHLKVSNLDRALEFYCGILGFNLVARFRNSAAFIAAGDYHHHLGLNTWESLGASPPSPHHTGLYHIAIRYPTRHDLATAVKRLRESGIPLRGASDHGVSVSVYLTDPDGIGLELTWDRPAAEWPRTPEGDVELRMSDPFDLEALLREAVL